MIFLSEQEMLNKIAQRALFTATFDDGLLPCILKLSQISHSAVNLT